MNNAANFVGTLSARFRGDPEFPYVSVMKLCVDCCEEKLPADEAALQFALLVKGDRALVSQFVKEFCVIPALVNLDEIECKRIQRLGQGDVDASKVYQASSSTSVQVQSRQVDENAIKVDSDSSVQVDENKVHDASSSCAQIASLAAQLAQACANLIDETKESELLIRLIVIRKILTASDDPPIDAIVCSGVLPRLLELVRSDSVALAIEATWCTSELLSGSVAQTAVIVDAGAVRALMSVLRRGANRNNDDAQCAAAAAVADLLDQACWALGNATGDVPVRDSMLRSVGGLLDAVAPLVGVAGKLDKTIAWLLSNLCRPPVHAWLGGALLSTCIARLAAAGHRDAFWALSFCTEDEAYAEHNMEALRVPIRACALAVVGAERACKPMVRALGNLCGADNDALTQLAVDEGAVPALCAALSNADSSCSVKKEAAWALSNIAAGTQIQVRALLAIDGVVELLGCMIADDDESDAVRKESAYALANVVENAPDADARQLAVVAIALLAGLLLEEWAPDALVLTALAAIEKLLALNVASALAIFDEANGIEALEELQDHENEQIYSKSIDLLIAYFGGE
jgi:importin subunit alpha-6/7